MNNNTTNNNNINNNNNDNNNVNGSPCLTIFWGAGWEQLGRFCLRWTVKQSEPYEFIKGRRKLYWPRPSPPGGGLCGPAAPWCRRPGTWSPGTGPPEPPAARRWRWCGAAASCGSAAGWGAAARSATGCSCSCRTSSGAGPERSAPSPGCRSLHGESGEDMESHTCTQCPDGSSLVFRRITAGA